MTLETALPTATPAEAGDQHTADQLDQATDDLRQAEAAAHKPEGEKTPEEVKREKTPEEREISRLRRRVDNLTKRLYQQPQQVASTREEPRGSMQQPADSETLSLSRAELEQMVTERAKQLAPAIKQQEAEIEHRRSVVDKLAKDWGQEKFDAYARDLDDAFNGLADANGKPKPATDAIFEADDPRALIEYLADPDHTDEAEAIGRMGATQAARALTKLEASLQSQKAKAKPQPSKATAPIEAVRGSGTVSSMPDPANTRAYIRWANEQERGKR